ncbi:flagellar hook-length control protein FliK [Vibrio sp. CAU 1672]|uniref:flagellar hook-length control protein FliK n=1 Tax=Vibrio sp. CAU 1672 TaxID=3032594 RepID=UPI0023DBC7BA|nr:flagellar hook-length control protein FliK [Vibrio sp. CAU 1672]MDF2153736.1 flagellar hook-length control protein FliK [Vibrio sp. CAU 1672]
MNVNVSNVSAAKPISASESPAKAETENTEDNGFMQALLQAFSGSSSAEQVSQPHTAQSVTGEEGGVDGDDTINSGKESGAEDSATEAKVTEDSGTEAKVTAQSSDRETVAANQQVQQTQRSASADNLLEQSNSDKTSAESASSPVTVQGSSNPVQTAENTLESQRNDDVNKSSEEAEVHQQHVRSTLGEGQQLLGRLEQANRTLQRQPNEQAETSGKALPLESDFARLKPAASEVSPATPDSAELKPVYSSPMAPMPNQATEMASLPYTGISAIRAPGQESRIAAEKIPVAGTESVVISESGQVADEVLASLALQEPGLQLQQTVTVEEVAAIDAKLASEQPLSQSEVAIVEGLRHGDIVVEASELPMVQFTALSADLKTSTPDHQAVKPKTPPSATPHAAAQVIGPDNKQVIVQGSDKPGQAALADAGMMASSPIVPHTLPGSAPANPVNEKVLSNNFAAGGLKGLSSQKDKPEAQHGLAGQLQAAAGQQGVTTTAQVMRTDPAQQAQVSMQLTREMANDQVAEKVQMMMSKNLKNLDIRLDPPELGRMQIRMTMNNDLANVHFTVTNPQAREIIEQTLPRLREMLAQQGMQLADSSVQQQNSGQQQRQYAASDQAGQQAAGRGFGGQTGENFDADANLDLNVVSKRDGISFYA